MCGIAGIYSTNPNKLKMLNKMLSKLHHRGPDEDGLYNCDEYCSGIKRLSINDLSGGSQPLFNHNRSIAVVYNGEIYNYHKLRKSLEKKNYVFRTNSDGEVIAHLYDDVGEKVFDYLDGMFAISIWDNDKKILFLARDTAGEKPVYYMKKNGQFIFSSEIKSIQCAFPEDLTINSQSIWDMPTFLWVPDPNTIYKEILALPKGNYLKFSVDNCQIKPINCNFVRNDIDEEIKKNPIKLTKEIVEEAIISRLLSDVPIGCFLSGGLDSTIVSTVASKRVEKLSTFNIAFENITDPYHGMADESEEAESTAKKINSEHHKIFVNEDIFYESLKEFSYYGDQPFAVSSGMGIYIISKEAKKNGIKVLLSGDGADECFGGYSWYPFISKICGNNYLSTKNDQIYSMQNFMENKEYLIEKIKNLSTTEKAYSLHYYAHELEKSKIFSKELQSQAKQSSLRHFESISETSPKNFIDHDRNFYFPNEMLCKMDRMTMANSVEGRAPFASANVLQLSEKISLKNMIHNDKLKWILREAFKDILPKEVYARKKHGFNIPIDHWIRGKWYDLVLHTFSTESRLYKKNLIHDGSLDYVKNMINDEKRLNGHTLFSYIMLNLWLENNGTYS